MKALILTVKASGMRIIIVPVAVFDNKDGSTRVIYGTPGQSVHQTGDGFLDVVESFDAIANALSAEFVR